MIKPLPTDWANRWLGGMCPAGAIGGLAVRGPDYVAHPPLDQILTLPRDVPLPNATLAQAQAAWSEMLGGLSVVLVRNADAARAALLRAADVAPGEPVGLPANATRALCEVVKHHPAQPRFLDLDAQLALCADAARLAETRVVWAQPFGGLPASAPLARGTLLVDASDTLPLPGSAELAGAAAWVWGLHLATNEREAGALIACVDPGLARMVEAQLTPNERPDAPRVVAQLRRLVGPDGVATQQGRALAEVARGLREAAGLPQRDPVGYGGLAQHIAVRVPEPCDAATFYAYVLGENTPVRWLPALRPLHYAALRVDGAPEAARTAAELARWLLVPVGPGYTDEEVAHAILGPTKAADYLGVRWHVAPERSRWYADLMNELYDDEHDAYRPLGAQASLVW